MPIYTFKHPKTGTTVDVLMSMNETHEYIKNGVKWDRVWQVPAVAADTIIDPFSSKDFLRKTQKGGTMGDLFDLSAELGERRKNSDGVDIIKEQTEKKKKEQDKKIIAERRKQNSQRRKGGVE